MLYFECVCRISTKVVPIAYTGASITAGQETDHITAFKKIVGLSNECSPFMLTLLAKTNALFQKMSPEEELSWRRVVGTIMGDAHPRLVKAFSSLAFFLDKVGS